MTLPASRSDSLARRVAGILAVLCAAGALLAVPIQAGAPADVRISNITDQGFSLSWVSAVAETGYLRWGADPGNLSARAEDDRGAGVSSTTHHITIGGLTAVTAYYVDLVSGATVDNNGGAHYRVTTGPALDPGSPATVYGQVSRPGGSSPAGIVYYATLRDANGQGTPGDSSLLSGIVQEKDQGYWYLNLGIARLADLSGRFAYSASGDKVALRFVGGPGQALDVTLDTGAAAPAAPIALPAAPPPATATPAATSTPVATLAPTFTATPPVATPSPSPTAAKATVTPIPTAPPAATATSRAPLPTATPSLPLVSPVATVAVPPVSPVPTGAPATPLVPATGVPESPSPTPLLTVTPAVPTNVAVIIPPSAAVTATATPAGALVVPGQALPGWLPVLLAAGPVIAVILYLAARRARRS